MIVITVAAYYIFTAVDLSSMDFITDGYTDKQSYFPGDTVVVYIQPFKSVRKGFFRLNDIKGNKIGGISSSTSLQSLTNKKAWSEGFGYSPTFQYVIPENLESGIYLWEDKIPFVVKNKMPTGITVVYPFNTINAYSNAGGKSLYPYNSSENHAADTVSFLRPYATGFPYLSEFVKWINSTGYDISYIADLDLDDPVLFKETKLLIIAGNSSSWTRKARENFENYIAEGGDALILAANNMYWNIRYNKEKNQMICFKSCIDDNYQEDPTCPWINKGWSVSSTLVADFNNGGYHEENRESYGGYKILRGNSPLLKGTNLKRGDTLKLQGSFFDGTTVNISKESGLVVTNEHFLKCYKKELLGIEKVYRNGAPANGTFLLFQKKEGSGVVINAASSEWCSSKGMGGPDSVKIKQITKNMIDLLIKGDNVFSESAL